MRYLFRSQYYAIDGTDAAFLQLRFIVRIVRVVCYESEHLIASGNENGKVKVIRLF